MNKIQYASLFISLFVLFKLSKAINSSEIQINNNTFVNNTITIKFFKFNWPVLLFSIFPICGLFGNYLVCCAILRDQTLQTRTNFYLFSLAITDLAVCLVVAPLSIVKDFLGKCK